MIRALARVYGVSPGDLVPDDPDEAAARHDTAVPPSMDMPQWITDLREAVIGVSAETKEAIYHQEQAFVGEMRVIGEQLFRMGDAIEKRDAQAYQLFERLLSRLESSDQALRESRQALAVNQQALAANQATMEASNRLIESQSHALDANRKTLEQVKSRLDDPSDDCGEDDAADDDGTHGPSRGPR